MTRETFGIFLALGLFALGPLGCTPKPSSEEDPQVKPAAQTQSAAPEAPALAPIAATAAVPATARPAPAAVPNLRIVSWNLEWFPGHKPEATPEAGAQHMEIARAALVELKPDILLLEEIRDWESAAELVKAVPGMQVHVASRFQPRPQNQVVASRFCADSTWSDSWQPDGITPPRGYSFAAIELPDHRFLLTYALHLKSNLGDFAEDVAMRQAAARQLVKHASEMLAIYGQRGPCAVVVGGDLNTSLDDPKFKEDQTLSGLIKAGFHWTFDGVPFAERTTIPAKNGFADNCFDHIFTAGLGIQTAKVKSYPGISDHNPVVLDVDLAKADFRPQIDPVAAIALLAPVNPAMAGSATPPGAPPLKLEAGDAAGLLAAVGRSGVVKGRVQKVASTKTNSIHFINFAGVPRGGFTGIVRQAYYDSVALALGGELKGALEGKTIELRGEIVRYKEEPQIVITSASQITVLKE